MSESTEGDRGTWASLKRVADAILAAAQNRVELFALEIQEEKSRLVETLLCAAALAVFSTMAFTVVTLAVVLLFWENGRMAALGILSVFYLTGTAFAWRALQARLKAGSSFADSLSEIRKDRACLTPDP